MPTLPLWEMMATPPLSGNTGEPMATMSLYIEPTPMVFGPMKEMLPSLAILVISRSSSAPSSSTSRKPEVMTVTASTRFSTHSFMAAGTALAGMVMTAMSTSPGMSASDL